MFVAIENASVSIVNNLHGLIDVVWDCFCTIFLIYVPCCLQILLQKNMRHKMVRIHATGIQMNLGLKVCLSRLKLHSNSTEVTSLAYDHMYSFSVQHFPYNVGSNT